MTIDKKKIGKFIGVSAAVLGTAFVSASVVAKKKKAESNFENEPEQQNPLEGKKVVFVEDENDKENADGVRGHLEAVGNSNYKETFYTKYVKRGMDVVLSFGALVALSPVLGGIALAIKIEDPGPVLFTQKRMGQNKKYFKIHKFRSMKMNTPHDVPTHMLENPEQYITKVGKFIRAHSLDELPQIWDIFVGNMSIIGPRPGLWNQDVLTAERDKYGANDVKPGLTGWAQINGRDELEISEKAKLDGEYVKNMGPVMDAKVFLGSLHVFGKDNSVVEGGTGEMKKQDKKRVAVLSSHTPSLFWFRMDMMKRFQECGYEVFALGDQDESEWKDKFAEQGVTYKQIKVERNGVNPVHDLATLTSIKKVLAEIKPEKLFTFQAKTIIYGGIAASLLGIKEVYPLVAGMGSVFLKDDIKTKVIRQIMIAEYKTAMRNSPTVFFQNHDDEKIFKDNHIVTKQNVVLIPGSGVNCQKFTVTEMPETFGFLCISRLIRDKGVYEYLEACKKIKEKYPEIRCLLVGPYDTNPSALKPEELKPFIDDGIIEYFGEQEDVRPYLEQCMVFVLPSYREGTPKTNLEAMASGRAIITTDAPGCRETVVDGENGYLVPVKNVDCIVEKMEYLINNPDVAVSMGLKGRAKVESTFDVEIVNQKICDAMGMSLEHVMVE